MRQPIINIGARHGEKHSPVPGRAQFATIPRHLRHGSATPAGPVHNAPAPRLRCPKCGHKHCSALQSRKLYQCRHRFQVSLTQGAIFASIKLLLPIWMLAIYLVTQSTPRAASSFSLCAVPWSTGAQRLSAGFYFFRHTPFNWIYWPAGVFSMAFCPASCSTACSCVLFRLAISS